MATLEIISPVHIGDGDLIEAPCFHTTKNKTYRYRFSDLLEQIPPKTLLDARFLKQLMDNQSSKREFYANFNRINYSTIDPLYAVDFKWDENLGTTDVASQIKDLGKPYIPGSSLKGAIITALNFAFAITFSKKYASNIKNYIQNLNAKNLPEGFILDMVFGLLENRNKASDFMKEATSCILVSDIYFDSIEVNEAKRYNVDMPLTTPECIAPHQKASLEHLIAIDEKKLARLKESDEYPKEYKLYLSLIDLSMIVKSCNKYTHFILQEERSEELRDFYAYFEPANLFIDRLNKEIVDASKGTESFYLRLGMHTNYFFKTISRFFKVEMPNVFIDEFYTVFSPITKDTRRKNQKIPKPNTIPTTRTLLYNDEDRYMLAGFIKITL